MKAVALALALAALLPAATATAATPTKLRICAHGDYEPFVEFPARGDQQTVGVNPATCLTFDVGTRTTPEQIKVFGWKAGRKFYLTQGKLRPSRGAQVDAYGTYSGEHWAKIS